MQQGSGGAFGGKGIMNARRFPAVGAALCGMVVLAIWGLASFAVLGSAGIERAGALPIEAHGAPSLTADAELPDVPQAPAAVAANADVVTAAESVPATAADTTAASDEPKSIVEAALPASSQMMPPEEPPVQVATASTADPVPGDAKEAESPVEIIDECLVADICIDRYLWALYQRTPKEDSIKVDERRKVTVKKKGKTVTVTKSFTKLVDEDFAWKDPKAAEKAGMPMMDYVIGGMDRSFKLKLFHTLRAAEEAGLSPGITSAFRDDYRQSIASGLKAAIDRSFHGGSFRGGYGHGLAADVVSVEGATREQRWISSDSLWKWIDAHGKDFGIARPYLDRDPPHVAPIDGKEYAAHHRETKVQRAGSDIKKRNRLAVRDDHSMAKRPRTARSSKTSSI
ncbi:peptidase M15 [Bradyrhizobium sp. I1.14.4]|uniref:peptidase M15 n=1 Tax=unclassified Bradyrhizobium TaxID=2631580 RepID=UPI003D23A559